jgi:hypothetical protein
MFQKISILYGTSDRLSSSFSILLSTQVDSFPVLPPLMSTNPQIVIFSYNSEQVINIYHRYPPIYKFLRFFVTVLNLASLEKTLNDLLACGSSAKKKVIQVFFCSSNKKLTFSLDPRWCLKKAKRLPYFPFTLRKRIT